MGLGPIVVMVGGCVVVAAAKVYALVGWLLTRARGVKEDATVALTHLHVLEDQPLLLLPSYHVLLQ